MFSKSIFYIFVALTFFQASLIVQTSEKPYVSAVWSADLGIGNYKNPVLYADYSDPDAIRMGDYFYMTALPGKFFIFDDTSGRKQHSWNPLPSKTSRGH